MTNLPAVSDFTGATITEAQFKAAIADQRGYLAGLLGADGLPATALATLGAAFAAYVAKTGSYSVTTADRGRLIDASGSWTLALLAVATAGAGFSLALRNNGAGVITINPSGAELIDSAATFALAAGRSVLVICTGTAWVAVEIPGKVTQTATDTTAGRLLKVGDFGLGSMNGTITITDFNVAPGPSEIFRTGNLDAMTGAPPGASWRAANGLMMRGSSGKISTLLVNGNVTDAVGMQAWIGAKAVETDPMLWARLYHTANVLGTVSQSSGVPTGAVIERGASANGSYTRFADGTQICWHTMIGLTGSAATWTFPAAFSVGPVVNGNAVAGAMMAVGIDANPTATFAYLSIRDAANARRANTMHLTATGRWF